MNAGPMTYIAEGDYDVYCLKQYRDDIKRGARRARRVSIFIKNLCGLSGLCVDRRDYH